MVTLARWGSFHVGGQRVVVAGQPMRQVQFAPGNPPTPVDPNGSYLVGGLYAQFMQPAPVRGAHPMLFWHGGGLTGVTWESTPDGRDGWQHFFLRQGWTTYVSDAVERGRSGWSMIPEQFGGAAVYLPAENPWPRFRFGPRMGEAFPGQQFPVEAYDNFMRQCVPRFTTTDEPTLDAYLALLDRVGPCVLVGHSQAGQFACRAAAARPGLVKAMVLVEPAAVMQPQALAGVPMLLVYGDYIQGDDRWPGMRARGGEFAAAVNAAGGQAEVFDLPAMGIHGNSHMVMMDRNSDAVAALVQSWLARRGLWA
jgi:pimeloyl-ACP methyl ester carboxylesterase